MTFNSRMPCLSDAVVTRKTPNTNLFLPCVGDYEVLHSDQQRQPGLQGLGAIVFAQLQSSSESFVETVCFIINLGHGIPPN